MLVSPCQCSLWLYHSPAQYAAAAAASSIQGVDNPDQRLAQDLPLLTTTLAETLSVLAAAPFNVFWYTRLTYQVCASTTANMFPAAAASTYEFSLIFTVCSCNASLTTALLYQQQRTMSHCRAAATDADADADAVHMLVQVFGSWCPVAAAYAFFLAGAVLQRVVMLPVARGVFQQEAAEGSFRYNQVRIRTAAQEIAMYR